MSRAVFFDIDGTLIDCFGGITQITPKVEEAIRSLQEKGDYVFIATGRPYAFISKELLDFGFDGFILTNGAQAILNNDHLFCEPMEIDFIKEAISEFDKIGVQYILEGAKDSYLHERFKEFYEFFDGIGISRKHIKDSYDLDELEIQKIEVLCPDEESVLLCSNFLSQYPDYDHFASISQKSIEIYAKKNTKAAGILKVLEHLNIPVEKSYAFGDGTNDIEMIQTVGCGIVMGNATEELKKYADQITDTVHNDGVAVGIEKYLK